MVAPAADFESAFAKLPLVAILRGIQPHEVVDIADVLIDAGFRMIEVPLNSPDPFTGIECLLRHCPPDVLVGAGTVLTVTDAVRLGDIGARLMVTPNTDSDVIRAGNDAGMTTIIGCLTPGEALTAIAQGADAIKIFPAGRLAAGYAADLKAVLPSATKVLAVGGIGKAQMEPYHRAGYDGFGLGSCLYQPGYTAEQVRDLAHELLAVWLHASQDEA